MTSEISKEENDWMNSNKRAILVKEFEKKYYQSIADNKAYQRRQHGGILAIIIGWLIILASLYISLA